jgi:PAS domain S-box-containing protein
MNRLASLKKDNIRNRIGRKFSLYSGLPLLGAALLILYFSYTFQLQNVINVQAEFARYAAEETQNVIQGVVNETGLLIAFNDIPQLTSDQLYQKVIQLLNYNEIYKVVGVFTREGTLVAFAEDNNLVNTGLDEVQIRDTMDAALAPFETADIYFGPVNFDERTGEPSMVISHPVIDLRSGEVTHVLFVEFRLRSVWNSLSEFDADLADNIYILNQDNQVIAHRNPSVVLRGTSFEPPKIGGLELGMEGERVILGVHKIELGNTVWTTVSERRVGSALNLTYRLMLIIASLILLVSVAAIYLGVHILRDIVKPLETLSEAALVISGGDFSNQVPVKGADEIGKLSQAFNDMTTKLSVTLAGLQESRKRFRALVESTNDWIWEVDAAGNFTYVSPRITELLGYQPDALLGNRLSEFIYFEDEQQSLDILLKRSEDIVGLENVAHHRDGHPLVFETNGVPILGEQGEMLGYRAISRDITERKRTEDELEQYREHLEDLVEQRTVEISRLVYAIDQSVDGVVITDLNGVIEFANPAWAEMHGYQPNNSQGSPLNIFHDDEQIDQDYVLFLDKVRAEGASQGIFNLLHQDGHMFPASMTTALLKNGDGKPLGFVSIGRDITEQMEADAALQLALTKLEQSNQDLEQFAYVASHDLQEPLRMITSYLRLIVRRYEDKLDETGITFMNYAVDGAARMKILIDDLLAFSRVEKRGKELKPIDLNQVFQMVCSTLTTRIKESQAVVSSDTLPVVMGDESQMTQLFQNLISNALKFRKPDETPRVNIFVTQTPENWKISVQDNGIGLKTEYSEQIFVIFKRLHTRQEYEGTGIGLAICKRIVERHKGRIWVESKFGEGATFNFTLPIMLNEDNRIASIV